MPYKIVWFIYLKNCHPNMPSLNYFETKLTTICLFQVPYSTLFNRIHHKCPIQCTMYAQWYFSIATEGILLINMPSCGTVKCLFPEKKLHGNYWLVIDRSNNNYIKETISKRHQMDQSSIIWWSCTKECDHIYGNLIFIICFKFLEGLSHAAFT